MIVRKFKLALNAGKSIPLVIHANQYDHDEQWEFTLYNDDGTQYIPSSGAIVGIKSDNLGIINSGTVSGGVIIINETEQMTAAPGKAVFELMIDSQTHGTANFVVLVEPKPGDNATLSESDLSLLQEAIDSTSPAAIAEGVSDWMDENLTPTTPVVDASLTVSGAAADAKVTGDYINNISKKTKNLWLNGDVIIDTSGFSQFLLRKPLVAGTYTISCECESDYTTTTYSVLRFSTSQDPNSMPSASFIKDAVITHDGVRNSFTFTTTATAYSVRFLSGTTMSNSSGVESSWTNIQIESGSSASAYVKPITANDIFALHTEDLFISSSNIGTAYSDANDFPVNSIIGVSGVSGLLNYPPTTYSCEIITVSHAYDTEYGGIMQIAIPFDSEKDPNIYHRGKPAGTYKSWTRSSKDAFSGTEVEIYSTFEDGYIDTTGTSVSTTPVSGSQWFHKIIECNEGDQFLIEACGGQANRLQFVICDENFDVLEKSGTMSESSTKTINYVPWEFVATIPTNGKYLIVNHCNYEYNSYATPRAYKLSDNPFKNYMAIYEDGTVPYRYKTNESWKRFVVAAYESMVVILRNNKFSLSTDCGKTWNSGVDVTSIRNDIQRAYLFANGNLAFYTDTKAYYIDDWTSYQEATCYEQNGTAYVPSASTNFITYWAHAERKFINGTDMYVFGTYKLVNGERVLIWYTTDHGKTYKIAYEFNITGNYSIRHVHEVLYYEPADKFIVTTGDSNATQCMVFLFDYNEQNDTWTYELVGGPARAYKWAGMNIWNDEIYYCNDNTPGSVWKFKFADISDLSKHTCVLSDMYCDPVSVNFGRKGDMLVTQAHWRNTGGVDVPIPFSSYCASRIAYYSSDRKNFSEVTMPILLSKGESYLSYPQPVTSDGHLYCGVFDGVTKLPSVCVDIYVRLAGFKQAFSGEF